MEQKTVITKLHVINVSIEVNYSTQVPFAAVRVQITAQTFKLKTYPSKSPSITVPIYEITFIYIRSRYL